MEIHLPDNFDDYEWEYAAKGCVLNVDVTTESWSKTIDVYDPVRLAQTVADDVERLGASLIDSVVVVSSISRSSLEFAVRAFFDGGATSGAT